MTFDELVAFIEKRMSMSHIYQPLVIRALVDAGGSATLRQVALSLVAQDEPTLVEAEKTVVQMPLRVLRKHGVIEYDRGGRVLRLNVRGLSFEQKARVRALCEAKLGDYLERRGMAVWDYRLIDDSAVPYDLRYQVLAESDRRCALCGATEKERPLDVDHIVPRSRGGRNEKSNLQVLCSRCNRAKGNRDTRDFRGARPPERDSSCIFCGLCGGDAVEDYGLVVAVADRYPVTEGHMLVLPKRHTSDFFEMTDIERQQANDLLRVLRNRIRAEDPTVTGFNVGANCGVAAGQTVPHAHLHLIPRRDGDVDDPSGGIRGAIPGKQHY